MSEGGVGGVKGDGVEEGGEWAYGGFVDLGGTYLPAKGVVLYGCAWVVLDLGYCGCEEEGA